MGASMKIRPFEANDVEAVASLWQYWFRDKTRIPDPALVALVRRIYLEDPNVDDEIRPLVAEGDDGRMLGFLGASVMPVELDGERRKMAGVFPSVVDPEAPTSVATFLLRKFLTGPQAFTFSDGGHVKFERIWEALGGRVSQMQSLRWVKALRPVSLGTDRAGERGSVKPFLPLLRPVAGGIDRLARAATGGRLRAVPPAEVRAGPGFVSEPLTPALLAEVTPGIQANARMRPLHDEAHAAWQFREMARIVEQGEFTATLVRTAAGEPAGWYIYYLREAGVSRLFALEAHDRYLDAVLDHLLEDADRRGAGAVIGRMEPRLRRPLAERGTLIHNGGSLLMVHSADGSLMDDAELGRLAFSRLQGENWYWWAIDSKQVP